MHCQASPQKEFVQFPQFSLAKPHIIDKLYVLRFRFLNTYPDTSMTKPTIIKAVLGVASLASLLSLQSIHAVDINKANNATALNATGSWVGGSVPTNTDVAVWDSNVVAANTTVLGSDLAFQGFRIASPGGTAIINATGGFILSLGSAGIDMTAATQNFALRSNVALTSNQNWTVASGRTLEIGETGSAITGNFDVNLSGPGILSFRNSGMFTNAGTNLALSGGITLYSTNARILTSKVTFAGNTGFGRNDTGGQTISLQGNSVVNAGTQDVTLRDSVDTDVALAFTGASYSVTGPGNLRFLNGNAAGVIRVTIGNTDNTASISADMTIGNNVRMVFGGLNQFTTASDITVESGGFLTLNNNTGSSGVTLQTIGSLAGAGTVERNGSNASISSLTINGGVSTGTTTFSGVIQDGGTLGRVAINKAGANTQVFSGANTYTGQTQVTGGSLLVNGTHIEAALVTNNGYGSSADGHYLVGAGGTLGGSGRIAGFNNQTNSNMILVQNGGTLAPGASIGTLVLDGGNISGTGAKVLNMAAGAEFDFELAGSGGTPDQIDFWNYTVGDLLFNANAINLTLTGPVMAGTYTVDIIRFFGDGGVTPIASGLTSGLVLGTIDPNLSGTPTIIYGTNAISIQYTTIPEPTAALLLAGTGLAALLLRRRRAS